MAARRDWLGHTSILRRAAAPSKANIGLRTVTISSAVNRPGVQLSWMYAPTLSPKDDRPRARARARAGEPLVVGARELGRLGLVDLALPPECMSPREDRRWFRVTADDLIVETGEPEWSRGAAGLGP
jgi:hypothetical protein